MTDSLGTLRRVIRNRPAGPRPERCEMCAEEIAPDHGHVVDLQSRQLLCACRPCYLLFTDERAHLRYRAIPDRYAAVGNILGERAWDELQIPVGLAFLFHNSALGRMVVLYPGPAGATESELDLPDQTFPELRPDVEALLLRRGQDGYLVPIDACYELVGRLRTLWRGFDGGQEAHAAVAEFFDRVRSRAGSR